MAETIIEIPLDELHPFPDHPFGVRDDDMMQQTVESVREYGVIVPGIARPREDGGYEIVSGHRRKHACELASLKTMPFIIRDIDRNTAKEMPEDAERKGLGTPATRAGIIEKLIATGFVERKKSRKSVVLVPANTGVSLITVLPEQLQSPLLTAEWEHKLKLVEHGELDADVFMAEISLMVSELVKTYSVIKGAEVLFPSGRDVVGKCPRCGSDVTESKKGFFCESNSCRFGLWRDNKFLTGKKITLTRKMAAALLKNGKFPVKGIFSEKTGKSYDAALVLSDDGTKSVYSLDFGKE